MLQNTNKTIQNYENNKEKYIYGDLSYKVLGILFDVFTELGFGYKEKVYQNAIAQGLRNAKLIFDKELVSNVAYQGKSVGEYYFDFLIEQKIVLEVKVRNYFSKKDIEQTYEYLKTKNLQLGIIAHFTRQGVKHKRVVNIA